MTEETAFSLLPAPATTDRLLTPRHRITAFVLLLVFVAALLRIGLAVRPGLWVDEVFSLAMATGHSLEHPAAEANPELGDYVEPSEPLPASTWRKYAEHENPLAGVDRVVRAVLLSDTSPPLYYVLLNLWTRVAGTSDAALRLFSTLWALLCFPLLWVLGREIGGRRAAWATCIFYAFSPVALYYATEGRMYSLLWFLGLLLIWSSLLLTRRGPHPRLLVLWIASAAAGLLSHYFFAFVWLAALCWLALYPGRLPRLHLAAATMVVGLLILPWYLLLPESLGRWRVTAGWLDYPLTLKQALTAPFLLAWSFLSGSGIWGGSKWDNQLAALLYALLILLVLRRGVRPLLSERRRLFWLWLFAAVLGVLAFDLLRGTNASLMARYALPGLPAAMLLAGLGISRLPRRTQAPFLLGILLCWTPGLADIFRWPPRMWQPFPEVAERLTAWTRPGDVIIVHSIPSGVLGVARYQDSPAPLASWVPQLGQRDSASDMAALTAGRCRVALVKIHDLGEPSPAELWLREHATLAGEHRLHSDPVTEILYFLPAPAGRSATRCPAWNTPAPTAPGTPAPPAPHTAG